MKSLRLITGTARALLVIFTLSSAGAQAAGTAGAGTPAVSAPESTHPARANRLIDSGSPYLLQHAYNPVEWYPWGPEALEKARRENKLIFLSVGYSTCYWCHVANRTLYSDPEIARLMNEWFVNIKVDREQRPDLDAIYMLARQLITGSGGWPNNVFLTPDLKPFFAGSYFPPADDEFGRPGFVTVLKAIHEQWTGNPDRVKSDAQMVVELMRKVQRPPAASARPADPARWLKDAKKTLLQDFDPEHGGFRFGNTESKFPQEPLLAMLMADYRKERDPALLEKLTATLDAMAYGGMRDHIGGGFHRYSTERTWSVPHFEKMLYNNAQLLKLYAEAWQLTRKPLYRQVATEIAAYLVNRMSAPEGGFYTAEDAEVNGEEGESYLWSAAEIKSALGAQEAKSFLDVYALTPLGNQRGADLLAGDDRGVLRVRLPVPGPDEGAGLLASLRPQRVKLLAVRERRAQPERDEKIVVALNGLTIEAFAAAGKILDEPGYVRTAQRAAESLWALAHDPKTRRLKHEIFRGRAQADGFLDDYALFANGLLALEEATGKKLWRERAVLLADSMLQMFSRKDGSLATTVAEKELVIAPLDNGDTAYPSGTSAAAALLLRLAAGEPRFRTAAERVLARLTPQVNADPEHWPVLVAAAATTRLPEASKSVTLARAGNDPPASQTSAPAPVLPGTAAHVQVSASIRARPAHEEIVVSLKIDAGYHVNANPASFDYLIPTAVTFDGITPSHITYPEPTLFKPAFAKEGIKVYQGNVEIVAEVPKGTLQRHPAVTGTVSAQACNDEVCLPPAKMAVTARGR